MTKFSLLNVPYIPKVKILRHLRNKELIKMMRTCRSMKTLAHQKLGRRKVKEVDVTRIQTSAEIVDYLVEAFDRSDREYEMEYRWNKSDPYSLPFFVWFAKTFTKTDVELLGLYEFDFDEEPMEGVEDFCRKMGISIDKLFIQESMFGSGENCVKLFWTMRPNELRITQLDISTTKALLTASFLDFISTLKWLQINDCLRWVDRKKDQEREKMLYKTLRLPNVANLIKTDWLLNGVAFGGHTVTLSGQFRTVADILEAIELPQAEKSQPSYMGSAITFITIKLNNREITICETGNYFENSDAWEWEFS